MSSYGRPDAVVHRTVLRCSPAVLLVALLLSACSSAPRAPVASPTTGTLVLPADRDGPEARPPAHLADVPDAEPQVEVLRSGGPNKPYRVLGRDYTPISGDRPHAERGLASWYGRKFHGRRTANGEVYDMYAMTAAHPTLPLPSYVRVRNPANQREVVVRVNDRGPFHPGRVIDLSYTAALKLDLLRGVAPVEIERITHEEIRAGTWRRSPSGASTALARAETTAPASVRAPSAAATPVEVLVPADEVVPVAARMADRDAVPSSAAAVPVPVDNGLVTTPADAAPPVGFWIQLGAFGQLDGAQAFQQRVGADSAWLAPLLAVFSEPGLHRLQAGPYASREDAEQAAQRVRTDLRLVPVVVQRR